MPYQYSDMVNAGGTVYNKTTNTGYANEGQLAADLGIGTKQIQWNQIQSDPNFNPTQTLKLMNESVQYNPTSGQAITIDQLKPEAPINVASTLPQASPDTAGALVAGASTTPKSLDDYIKLLTPPESETNKQYNTLSDQISTLLGQTTDRTAYQLEQEKTAAIPQLKQQIQDINTQINTKLAEFNKLAVDNENKPVTMSSIIGTDRAIRNAAAAEIGLLQARAAGLQGNLSLANEQVDRAVNLKFQPLLDQINVKMKQLSLIEGRLNKEEQVRADALRLYLSEQKEQLQIQQDKESTLQKIAIQAASAGAPQNLVSQAIATKDPVQASSILNQYLRATGEGSGSTSNGYFTKPTPTQLGGAQFYKYPSSTQVFTSNGTAIDLQTYKQLTNQTNVPDEKLNWSFVKTIDQNAPTTSNSSSTTRVNTSTKPVSVSDRSRYYLPSYVTQGDFTNIKNAIRAVIQEAGGVNDANRYDLWGQVSDAMVDLNLQPSVWDSLLWEAFHPEGLAGYKKYKAPTTTTKSSSPASLEGEIEALFSN